MKIILLVLLTLGIAGGIAMAVRPLPPGLSVVGSRYRVPAESITFLADRTYVDAAGDRFSEQQIFDEVLAMIARADHHTQY